MPVLRQNGYVVYIWGSMSFERHLYWQATKKEGVQYLVIKGVN